MANSTMAAGTCMKPFLLASDYPETGGFVPGRFCGPVSSPAGTVTCCLPCPQTDWVYPDKFFALSRIANYINVLGIVFCVFLLVTFALLPLDKTHRHYLSVCVVLAVILMQLGFVIPLGAKPKQCYNDITPNDMYTDIACAFSGACLLAGGWCTVMWVFMRALSLHLQICWQVVPGRKFFVTAQLAGWGIPIVLVGVSLAITGVSYRFGDTCHVNHANAMHIFWGPLLAFAGAAIVIQFATFGYCIKVYLQALMEDRMTESNNGSALPSYSNSIRTTTAAQAYVRVRRVIGLHWRGIVIVLLILVNVIYFSIIFVYYDTMTQRSIRDLPEGEKWVTCLVVNRGNKNKCLNLAEHVVLNQATVMSVLILQSINGIWCLLLLGRWSMVRGWIEWFKTRFGSKEEFVSIDARRFSSNKPRSYEMLKSPPQPELQSPEPVMTPDPSKPLVPAGTFSPVSSAGKDGLDYFGGEASYNSPHLSFSTPRPPCSPPRREWDPASTHAPSMASSLRGEARDVGKS